MGYNQDIGLSIFNDIPDLIYPFKINKPEKTREHFPIFIQKSDYAISLSYTYFFSTNKRNRIC